VRRFRIGPFVLTEHLLRTQSSLSMLPRFRFCQGRMSTCLEARYNGLVT